MSRPTNGTAEDTHVTRRTAYRQFGITGVTCAGEAAGLERRLRTCVGVLKAVVNPVTECAYITYDPSLVDLPTLVSAIEAAGYGVG